MKDLGNRSSVHLSYKGAIRVQYKSLICLGSPLTPCQSGRILWQNYAETWTLVPFWRWALNSTLVTVVTMGGQICSATVVADGFSRFDFTGRGVLVIILMGTMIVPSEVTIIPQFLLFKGLGWLNTYLPLIAPSSFGGSAFTIFLLRQFFLTLPRDLDDAAEIDGAGTRRVLVQILVPRSKPALATMAIFALVSSWNDFFGPLIYLHTEDLLTVALGLYFFKSLPTPSGPVLMQLLMAAASMMTLPVVVVFFSMQRYFLQGIVLSGLKG
jgi:multiple sugar transport system permease protein